LTIVVGSLKMTVFIMTIS